MDIKLKRISGLIIIYTTTIFSKCNKSIICDPDPIYSFSISAKAYPDRDSIQVNDTIIIEIKEPTSLVDLNSNNLVDFSGAKNLGMAIAFGKLLGNSTDADAANDFNFLLIKGKETIPVNTNRFREYLFSEENGYYVFKLEVIPQKEGVFGIGLSNAGNVSTGRNPCDKANFLITFMDTDQHLYFNQWNYGVTPPLPNGSFFVKVKK